MKNLEKSKNQDLLSRHVQGLVSPAQIETLNMSRSMQVKDRNSYLRVLGTGSEKIHIRSFSETCVSRHSGGLIEGSHWNPLDHHNTIVLRGKLEPLIGPP